MPELDPLPPLPNLTGCIVGAVCVLILLAIAAAAFLGVDALASH